MSGKYYVPLSNTKQWTDVFQNKVPIQIFGHSIARGITEERKIQRTGFAILLLFYYYMNKNEMYRKKYEARRKQEMHENIGRTTSKKKGKKMGILGVDRRIRSSCIVRKNC
jgi:hypothetical protein